MPSFSIPLSGLAASSQALNVISNNLANLNTVGFKDQSANFQDLFYQNFGSDGAGDPIQSGAGTEVGSVSGNFSNGSLQNTGVSSNVAITGAGFFVTQQSNGAVDYTRAGDFTVNSAGQLVTTQGQTVMGYPAVNGVVNQSATLTPLLVGQGQNSPPAASTTMQQQTNLNAASTVGTTYSTPMTVYDSLGESHVLTFNYTMSAPNAWTYQVTLPAADTGGAGAPTVLASGNLTFNSSGNLTAPVGLRCSLKLHRPAPPAPPTKMVLSQVLSRVLPSRRMGRSRASSAMDKPKQSGSLPWRVSRITRAWSWPAETATRVPWHQAQRWSVSPTAEGGARSPEAPWNSRTWISHRSSQT